MKGIDIGDTYTNRKAARTFVHFIAEAIRREMRRVLQSQISHSII